MNQGIEPLHTYWELYRCKDRKSVCRLIVHYVEQGTGKKLTELKESLSEDALILEALKHVTTTKKSLIKALNLDVDNVCRYKRELEKNGHLVQSVIDYTCPFTRRQARLLTTNKAYFESLGSLRTNQLGIFD